MVIHMSKGLCLLLVMGPYQLLHAWLLQSPWVVLGQKFQTVFKVHEKPLGDVTGLCSSKGLLLNPNACPGRGLVSK